MYYRLGSFEADEERFFDEICQTNGQSGVRKFNDKSNPRDPQSFSCRNPIGSYREEMNTVVVAPDGTFYLTDGHHVFNAYWSSPKGGPDMSVNVVVAKDYRNFKSMEMFWKAMKADRNVWIFDAAGNPADESELPGSLGMDQFQDDPVRSLLYFARGIFWEKRNEIPFADFYWTREVQKGIKPADLDLSTRAGYFAAVCAVGNFILQSSSADVGGSKKSANELGKKRAADRDKLAQLNRPKKGKLAILFDYKEKNAVSSR